MSDLKICFMGTPDFARTVLESLVNEGYKVVLFCNENEVIASNGKTLKNVLDGYTISLERF